jgi:2-polyprenyl-3-methyl-5-hydroxy-6-metoxy-1,4-benzoquinol methylase
MTSHFSKAAAGWETQDRIELAEKIWKCMDQNIRFQKDMKAADIGAGTGLLTVPLAGKTAHVTAVDSSKEMLEVLKAKIREKRISNIDVLAIDAGAGSLPLSGLSVIISSMTLHHIEDTQSFLKSAAEALPPGGVLGIADLDKEDGAFHKDPAKMGVHHQGFERESLVKAAVSAGFGEIHFYDAASVTRTSGPGAVARYPVFLMTAVKK